MNSWPLWRGCSADPPRSLVTPRFMALPMSPAGADREAAAHRGGNPPPEPAAGPLVAGGQATIAAE